MDWILSNNVLYQKVYSLDDFNDPLFIHILRVLCVVLTSDLSRLIHTSLLKKHMMCASKPAAHFWLLWSVCHCDVSKDDSLFIQQLAPFPSQETILHLSSVVFLVYDLRFFSFRMSVLLTGSVCLFLCGFLPLFADFLSPLCLSPLFFSLPHPMKRWDAWIWLSERVGGGGSSGARRNFDLGVALGPSFASHCSCFQMKRLKMCFLIGFSLPRSVDVRI